MVGTRSTSMLGLPATNSATLPTITNTTVTTSVNSGAIPRRQNMNVSVFENLRQDDLEASGESISGNSTIITPTFSGVSAKGAIDAFHHNNNQPRHQDQTHPPSQTSSVLTPEDLRNFEDRLLSLIPRLIQQSINSQTPHHQENFSLTQSSSSFPDFSQPPPINHKGLTQQIGPQPFNIPPHNRQDYAIKDNVHPGNNNTNAYNLKVNTVRGNFVPHHIHTNTGQASRPQSQFSGQASENRSQHASYSSSRVDKWGITFDGTNKTPSVEDFVFRVETLQADFGCDWRDVIRSFHHLLSGAALDWFWDYRRFSTINRWIDLKAALITQFHRFDSDFDIQRKILDRRQHNSETFDEFYNAVIKLRNQLQIPIGEKDLVNIMRGNLKAPMAQLLFAVQIQGLSQFAVECRRAENLIKNHRQYSARIPPRSIHEIECVQTATAEVPELDALSGGRKLNCWNCKGDGHFFFDCPEEKRNLFCYKCGLENTVTPRCPVCQGNRSSNVSRTGIEMRSQNQHPKSQ